MPPSVTWLICQDVLATPALVHPSSLENCWKSKIVVVKTKNVLLEETFQRRAQF